MKIVTRKEAIEQGLSRYFTGRPCKNGHLAEKTTKKSMCVDCKKLEYLKNAERYKATNRAWKLANPELVKQLDAISYIKFRNDPIRMQAKRNYSKTYSQINKDRILAASKAWDSANPDKRLAYAKHHKAIRKRLVAGQALAKTYSKEIREIYLSCPPGYHVDHIVPLKGKLVTGLHVPWNLQYLPAIENVMKGNKYEV